MSMNVFYILLNPVLAAAFSPQTVLAAALHPKTVIAQPNPEA